MKSGAIPLGLGVIPLGFWRWPLIVCLALAGAFGMNRLKPPVNYYRAEAMLKTVNRPAQLHDLMVFRSDDVRYEIASALGWIKPHPSALQRSKALAKLAQVLTWEADGADRLRLSGVGKEAAGIAWVVNTAAKTTVACSAHAASPTPWRVLQPAQPMPNPWKVDGRYWPAVGVGAGALLGFFLFGGKRKTRAPAAPVSESAPQTLLTYIQDVAAPPLAKPVAAQSAPIPLEVIEPKPAAALAPEALSAESIYKEWKTLAGPLYAVSALSVPKDSARAVDALIVKTTAWAKNNTEALLRRLAATSAEETIVGHIVHLVLITLLWCLREGASEEDSRTLLWIALVHDMGLKHATAHELLRFPAERSRESAGHLLTIHGLDDDFKALLAMIVTKLGGKKGMQPSITPREEKAEQLARLFTPLDRKEKILRRGALQLAKQRSLKKAI